MTLPAPLRWERQPGESAKAFAAFAVYRDLGSARSITSAAKDLGKSRQLLSEWAMTHGWVSRAADWDREEDRLKREATMVVIRQMAVRHAGQAQAAQNAAMYPLQAMANKIAEERKRNDGESPFLEALLEGTPAQALELVLLAAAKLPAFQQAERLARGEPTEIVAAAIVDLTPAAATDDLARLFEAMSRVGMAPLLGPALEPDEREEPPPLSLAR